MSQENVEIVRRLQPPGDVDFVKAFADEGFVEAYVRAAGSLLESDFESVFPPGAVGPSAGARRGITGFLESYGEWLSAWQSWYVETEDYVELSDDRVLVLLTDRGVSKTGGVEMAFEGAAIFTLRDQKVCRMEMFLDRREALEAAGLSE